MKRINKLPEGLIIKKIYGGRELITEENLKEYFKRADENKYKRVFVAGARKCVEIDNNYKKYYCMNLEHPDDINSNMKMYEYIFIGDITDLSSPFYKTYNSWDAIVLEHLDRTLIYDKCERPEGIIKYLLPLLRLNGQLILQYDDRINFINLFRGCKITLRKEYINEMKDKLERQYNLISNYINNDFEQRNLITMQGYKIEDIFEKIENYEEISKIFFNTIIDPAEYKLYYMNSYANPYRTQNLDETFLIYERIKPYNEIKGGNLIF